MSLNFKELLTKGFFRENPIFVLLLGMCPTLGVTTSAVNGLGMGLATTAVLVVTNLLISLLKNLIPEQVRIPAYIVLIASVVTVVQFLLMAYLPELYEQLGIFIPLIIVNCIILGRAEAFASKNSVPASILDGVSMGLGFAMALTMLGSIREILGSGSIFGLPLLPEGTSTILIFVMPPGAFIALGLLIASVRATGKLAGRIRERSALASMKKAEEGGRA